MKKFNFKKMYAIVGVCLIIIGIVVFTGGKLDPINSRIINPTWQTILVGALFMFAGWLIGKKHFKNFLDDPNIR